MKTLVIFLSFMSFLFANDKKDIFVINYGWHSAIVLKVEDIESRIWQVDPFFKEFKYIEVGWGDEEFYKSSNPSLWMTFKAALLPTSSVLHLRAVTQYNLDMFPKENIVKITIPQTAFTNLSVFIENSFAKKDDKPIILSQGLYPNSLFYISGETYHIFYTCNVWTANALKSAELDVSPFSSLTTDSLFSQIRELVD